MSAARGRSPIGVDSWNRFLPAALSLDVATPLRARVYTAGRQTTARSVPLLARRNANNHSPSRKTRIRINRAVVYTVGCFFALEVYRIQFRLPLQTPELTGSPEQLTARATANE